VRIFKKQLKPDWAFKSDRKVWRLLISNGILVGEFRDVDKKNTEFGAIDLSSGSLLWKNDEFEDKWWTTLNIIHKNTVLLQQFDRPDMPTPGKIFALDLHTGKLLWQNHEVSFMNAVDDVIYCLKKSFPTETMVGLNFRTGIGQEIPASEFKGELQATSSELLLPELIDDYPDNSRGQAVPHRFTHLKIPSDAKQAMLLKFGQKNVIGFHIPTEKDAKGTTLYDAHLIVTDPNGKIVFEDTVDRKAYVPLADFYFGYEGRLIYIKNSEEIVAIKLD